MLHRSLTAIGVVALCATVTPSATADTFDFIRITSNSSESGTAANLKVDVTDGGGGEVDFRFYWTGDPSGSIAEIYFDDGTLLALASIDESDPGVDFEPLGDPVSPSDLPGGNSFLINGSGPYTFEATQAFSSEAESGNANGVQWVGGATEEVIISFTLQGGQTFADVITAMNNAFLLEPGASEDPIQNTGGLVIGLHVRSQGDGESDAFISRGTSTPVPLPMTFGLGMAGLAPLALRRRRSL